MLNQQCGPRGFTELKQPPPPHSHYAGGGQVIVDVENEMLRRYQNVILISYLFAIQYINYIVIVEQQSLKVKKKTLKEYKYITL